MRIFFTLIVSLLLFLFIPLVLGEELTADNFAEPIIKVNNKTFLPNESVLVFEQNKPVTVDYTIKPKKDEDATKVDGRMYYTYSDLVNVKAKYTLIYREAGGWTNQPFDIEDGINVPNSDNGLDYLKINLTGYTPTIDERLKAIYALRIRVQDGGYILPPVVVYVINYQKFQEDLNSAEKKYNNLNKILTEYLGKVDTSKLAQYLDLAGSNLTLAKDNYNDKNYIRADEKLRFAEEWLIKAQDAADGVVAEYAYKQAKDILDEVYPNLDKIDIYLKEIESRGLINVSELVDYKAKFNELKNKASIISQDLGSVKALLDAERYKDAKEKAFECLNSSKELRESVNALLNELKSLIPESTATPTETTPTPTTVAQTNQSILPSIKVDWKKVGIIIGIVVAGVVVVGVVITVLRRYMKRRKWDELG